MEKLNSKKAQRLFCKQAISKLDEETKAEYSRTICEKLLPYITDKNIMSYFPVNGEVDVSEINDRFSVSLPVISAEKTMIAVKPVNDRYILNRFNIMEPDQGITINKNDIDVIIVPLLGFDEKRNRLGHGAGYYDLFLTDCSALKIGVGYEAQKLDEVITEKHDIPLDLMITEKGVY